METEVIIATVGSQWAAIRPIRVDGEFGESGTMTASGVFGKTQITRSPGTVPM
jgi:hypothetical protein